MSTTPTIHYHADAIARDLQTLDHYVSVPVTVYHLMQRDIDLYPHYYWEQYNSISILDKTASLAIFLKHINFSLLPTSARSIIKDIVTPVYTVKSPCPRTCILTFSTVHPPVLLTCIEMLRVLLEITMRLEWRTGISIEASSTATIPISSYEVCSVLAPWLRLIRVNRQDCVVYLTGKSCNLNATHGKAISGLYTTDPNELLIAQSMIPKEIGVLGLSVNDITNQHDFTDERMTHFVVQLVLLKMNHYTNIPNLVHTVALYLQRHCNEQGVDIYQAAISLSQTPDDLTGFLTTRLFTGASTTVLDRLLCMYYTSLEKQTMDIPTKDVHFITGVQQYGSYTLFNYMMKRYGNYAVAAITGAEWQQQYCNYLFVPDTTALAFCKEWSIPFSSIYDVQWDRGVTGVAVELSNDMHQTMMRTTIHKLYTSYPVPQPNFLFAMMSWFADPDKYTTILENLTDVEWEDLDGYAAAHQGYMDSMYKCWEWYPIIDPDTGKKVPRSPITSHHKWEPIRVWLCTVYELLYTFISAITCQTEIRACISIIDTTRMVQLIEWLPLMYNRTLTLVKAQQRGTESEQHTAHQALLYVLFCFYNGVNDLDPVEKGLVRNEMLTMQYAYTDEYLVKMFNDKRVMVADFKEGSEEEEKTGYNIHNNQVVKDRMWLIRTMLCAVLKGGETQDDYRLLQTFEGKCKPFLVFKNTSSAPVLIGEWLDEMGGMRDACLLRNSVISVKNKDTSALVTSIIRPDIRIESIRMRPALTRLMTDAARFHTLKVPVSQRPALSATAVHYSLKRSLTQDTLPTSVSSPPQTTKKSKVDDMEQKQGGEGTTSSVDDTMKV